MTEISELTSFIERLKVDLICMFCTMVLANCFICGGSFRSWFSSSSKYLHDVLPDNLILRQFAYLYVLLNKVVRVRGIA